MSDTGFRAMERNPQIESPPTAPLPESVPVNVPVNLVYQMESPQNGSVAASPYPPAYTSELDLTEEIGPPKADYTAPPPYEVATKLPTYDEVQQEKIAHGEHIPNPNPHTRVPLAAFFAIDTPEAHDAERENGLLGTDFMFFTSFLVSFLFNWIGFMLLMCFCHTVAARYGALSGFGLSLAKWTLIVKHSTDLASRENSWLWWLIMAFGLLICVRAIIQYINIKRGWRLLSGNAQERLLFFY